VRQSFSTFEAEERAQVQLEYLVIIGGALLIVTIVALTIKGVLFQPAVGRERQAAGNATPSER
jgi:uncharacterized protein (UPF0333 family)